MTMTEKPQPKSATEFLFDLGDHETIVGTHWLSPSAIANARAEGRMYVTENGFGYVRVRNPQVCIETSRPY